MSSNNTTIRIKEEAAIHQYDIRFAFESNSCLVLLFQIVVLFEEIANNYRESKKNNTRISTHLLAIYVMV